MEELERLIAETRALRLWHREQYQRGVKGACVEAAACAIRETALQEAKRAIQRERGLR